MSEDDSNQTDTDNTLRGPLRQSYPPPKTQMASYQSVSRANRLVMRLISGGMPAAEVECVKCGAVFLQPFPRSTTEILITAAPDPELKQFVDDRPNHRNLKSDCPNGDTLYYYFQW